MFHFHLTIPYNCNFNSYLFILVDFCGKYVFSSMDTPPIEDIRRGGSGLLFGPKFEFILTFIVFIKICYLRKFLPPTPPVGTIPAVPKRLFIILLFK